MKRADRRDRGPDADMEILRLDPVVCKKIVNDVLPIILSDLTQKGKWPPENGNSERKKEGVGCK